MKLKPSPTRPQHNHSDEYTAYLASPEWAATRAQALARARFRCAVCGDRRGLEVHHRTYERLGAEAWGDLVVLCAICHLAADRRRAGWGRWR